MKRTKSRIWAAGIAAPAVLTTVGLLVAAGPSNSPAVDVQAASATAARATVPPLSAEQMNVANSLSQAFRNVADRVLPAVVAIETRPDRTAMASDGDAGHGTHRRPNQNPFKGTPFEDMFRDGRLQQAPHKSPPRQSPPGRAGIGSGVIIDSAGIVLTNNHVVAGGGKVIVRTQQGREYEAMEVYTDPKTDIAVVRIEGDDTLVSAPLGDSETAAVGDWVVALGQPFGLESTVTAGIISAKNRGIGITDRENFIQTDAAINPGNSGGPLVNLHGEVVGINTAISSRGGGNNGVGFAVPSNLARWVSDQLVRSGTVRRAYLGVGIQPVSFELAEQLGVSPKSGVAVTNVFADTPAAEMGLQSGDVVVRFGDQAVSSPQQLQLAVERSALGSTVAVEVIRDGQTIMLEYEPATSPESSTASQPATEAAEPAVRPMGLEVAPLSERVAKQLGVEDANGVVITAVQPGSAAAEAGLKASMVIRQVNRQDVESPEQFARAVQNDEDGRILLLIGTSDGSRFVVVDGS
ncbi:Do family serine endopeptidase [Roseimaritima sediminicola]|uniref:Do family serine endopeptidase n=1 Tax=Roseimaritima sediminicola TaxID=2662066 RepID=UPI001298581F|nr:Do family serine endopeptidase [Roseimaritima sediminicola]